MHHRLYDDCHISANFLFLFFFFSSSSSLLLAGACCTDRCALYRSCEALLYARRDGRGGGGGGGGRGSRGRGAGGLADMQRSFDTAGIAILKGLM